MQIIGGQRNGGRRVQRWMHNGGTIPIVSDGSAKLGFQRHASDFSLLNKIMIIMELSRLLSTTHGSYVSLHLFYLIYAILFFVSKWKRKSRRITIKIHKKVIWNRFAAKKQSIINKIDQSSKKWKYFVKSKDYFSILWKKYIKRQRRMWSLQ